MKTVNELKKYADLKGITFSEMVKEDILDHIIASKIRGVIPIRGELIDRLKLIYSSHYVDSLNGLIKKNEDTYLDKITNWLYQKQIDAYEVESNRDIAKIVNEFIKDIKE